MKLNTSIKFYILDTAVNTVLNTRQLFCYFITRRS